MNAELRQTNFHLLMPFRRTI